jgi:putative DNA primase/helicase
MALGIAHAVASGGEFLGWDAPEPRKVLYFDGEMQADRLKRRLRRMHKAAPAKKALRNLCIVNPDAQRGILPDLGTLEGQRYFDKAMPEDVALVIIDNLSAWCRDGRETADHWAKVGAWASKHRSEGRAIIFVHHAGKNNSQRGTSKKEDQVDFTIALRHPDDYQLSDNTRFQVHFEKNRQLPGDKLTPMEVRYMPDKDGMWRWSFGPIVSRPSQEERKIVKLLKKKVKQSVIARRLGIKPYVITRVKNKAKKEGWL